MEKMTFFILRTSLMDEHLGILFKMTPFRHITWKATLIQMILRNTLRSAT